VRRRAGDNLEDFAGGRQVTITRLQLLEEADVLDGDHGLVGEGLEQGDLPVVERQYLGSADRDRADRGTFSHQGDNEYCAEAQPSCELAALRKLLRLVLQVSDVDSPPVDDRSTHGIPAAEWERELADRPPHKDRAVMSYDQESVAVPPEDIR